jgi:HSP20 family protein
MANLMRAADRPVLSLREAMDRLVEQSFTPFARASYGEAGSQYAPTNFWEDADHYYLHMLAPGIDPSSVEITATDGSLVVAGQVAAPSIEGGKAIWQEWGPVQFRRQFQLPTAFDAERCEATYDNGVLALTVPKPEQIKPRNIKVQVNR